MPDADRHGHAVEAQHSAGAFEGEGEDGDIRERLIENQAGAASYRVHFVCGQSAHLCSPSVQSMERSYA